MTEQTRSDQLRQALDIVSDGPLLREMTRHNAADFVAAMPALIDAARLALKVWEGDEQLVEQVAAEISDGRWANDSSPAIARAVLAAITEEEQK